MKTVSRDQLQELAGCCCLPEFQYELRAGLLHAKGALLPPSPSSQVFDSVSTNANILTRKAAFMALVGNNLLHLLTEAHVTCFIL